MFPTRVKTWFLLKLNYTKINFLYNFNPATHSHQQQQ